MALPNGSNVPSAGHDATTSISIPSPTTNVSIASTTFTQHPAPVKFPPLTMSTIDIIRSTASQRWFRNTELVDLLENFQQYGFKCSPTAAPTPPTSGNIMIFNKNQVRRWRQDGHEWKKKRDGKNIKEHHEKLKVAGVDVINCCYAHHETCEGFHRRGYWMLCRPHIVLVHYLQQYKLDHSSMIPGSLFAEPIQTGFDQYTKVIGGGHGARTPRTLPYNVDDAASLDSNKGALTCSTSSRKSILSRASRDKKKVYVDNLKHSIESLTAQISELEMHSDINVIEAKVIRDVRETLQNPRDRSLDTLLDTWFESNITRKLVSVHDMNLIRTMLIPGAQAKFALWGLDPEQSTLWSSLLEDQFQLQPAQVAELTRSRSEAVRLRNEFNEILNECKETHRLIEEYVSRSQQLIKGVRDIFPADVLAQGLSMFDLSQAQSTNIDKTPESLPA